MVMDKADTTEFIPILDSTLCTMFGAVLGISGSLGVASATSNSPNIIAHHSWPSPIVVCCIFCASGCSPCTRRHRCVFTPFRFWLNLHPCKPTARWLRPRACHRDFFSPILTVTMATAPMKNHQFQHVPLGEIIAFEHQFHKPKFCDKSVVDTGEGPVRGVWVCQIDTTMP